jgi:hypothetical protein
MKKLIFLTLVVSLFSFGQREFSYEQWYKQKVKARVSTLINDSIGTTLKVRQMVGSALLADTGAFSTTLASKAIYIPGALASDMYIVVKRVVQGTSTATPTDSCIISYMAKTDSLIVLRQGTYAASGGSMPSGTKFSWFRIKK